MISDEENVRLINSRHEVFLRSPIRSIKFNKDVPASLFKFRTWTWGEIKTRSRDKVGGEGRVKDLGSKSHRMIYRSY